MPFPYKTVLITGATSGIGRALAERMITSAGVFVIAVGRRKDRLDELVAKHGADKVAAEPHDLSDLASIPEWGKHITTKYPSLDCIVLNAGEQNQTDFSFLTSPSSITSSSAAAAALASTISLETTLNYLSPLHTIIHLLPHLSSLSSAGSPTSIILISSGLALVPIYRCANYSATKAALHSFAWTLRKQLLHAPSTQAGGSPTRVIEVIPPAVQTELHTRQGLPKFGMTLEEFTDETWEKLSGEEEVDEILVGPNKRYGGMEEEKRGVFEMMDKMMRGSGAA